MTARNQRLFAGLLVALVMLVVMWLARPEMLGVDAATAASNTAPAASAVVTAAGASSGSAGSAGSAASGAVTGAQASSSLAGAGGDGMEIPPEGIEACGVRRVSADELRRWKADPALAEAQVKVIDEQTQRIASAAVARLAARLAAGSERQQVAARLLMQDRDGAALLAERSSDAQAYQMALSACAWRGEGTPHCARLSARRWAELDPSDARPWLRLMAAAQQRKDTAGVDAALAEAAARPRLSRGSWLVEAQAVAVAEAVPDAADFGQALITAIGVDAAMPSMDIFPAFRVCKDEGLRDATRLAQCRAVARQVLAGTTDLTEATLAQKMADRVGVPAEQQAFDAATLKAAQDRFHQRATEDIGMDCAAMRRTKQLSTERAASGDLAMALALLKVR